MIYVASKDSYLGHKRGLGNHHYVDLPGGRVAVSGDFLDAGRECRFLRSGATSLDHICKSNLMANYPSAVAALASLGVTERDSTHSVREKLRALHPLF